MKNTFALSAAAVPLLFRSMSAPLTAAGILAAGLAGAPAQAAVYDWTADIPIIGGGAIMGSGQLTIGAGNLVTQISGTYGAATLTGALAPVGTVIGGTATGNDNLAFFPAAPTFLDNSGLGFDVNKDPGAGEGTVVNIFSTSSGGYTDNGSTLISGTGFSLTPATAAVPERSTWALMLLGFAGLGLAGYRASRRRAQIAA
jgi:hypothetical protein